MRSRTDPQGNYLFYMAIPPSLFTRVNDRLGEAGLLQETENDWRRVIIEKPFGRDLESAVALNCELHKNMDEDQIYRIDHYLGKETVQNKKTPLKRGFLGQGTPETRLHHPHAAHIATHAAARGHRGLFLGLLGHHGLGGDHEAGDRGGVLQRRANNLGRIQDAHLG